MGHIYCGWEMNSSIEVNSSSGLSIQSNVHYGGSYGAYLSGNNSYAQWTVSSGKTGRKFMYQNFFWDQYTAPDTINALHMQLGSNYVRVELTDNGSDFTVDVASDISGVSGTTDIYIEKNKWFGLCLEVSYARIRVILDGVAIITLTSLYKSDLDAAATYVETKVTDAGGGIIYIDDMVFGEGTFKGGKMIVAAKHVDATLSNTDMLPYPSGYDLWYLLTSNNGDTSYVYSTASSARSSYRCDSDYNFHVIHTGWEISTVHGVMVGAVSKEASDDGDKSVGLYIYDQWGTRAITFLSGVTTTYTLFKSIATQTSNGRAWRLEYLDDSVFSIGLRHTITSGTAAVRTTQLVCCVAFYLAPFSAAKKSASAGLDLRFTTSTFTSGQTLRVLASEVYKGEDQEQTALELAYYDATTMKISRQKVSGTNVETLEALLITLPGTSRWRIIFHEEHITVLRNDKWVHTFSSSSYGAGGQISVLANSSMTLTNVTLVELCDWRADVWIDMEQSGMAAVTSIIQERPVEILPKSDGAVAFLYNMTRDIVTVENIRRHRWGSAYNPQAGSHIIIHYEDAASYLESRYLNDDGYSTRVYRMPNLTAGAYEAAKTASRIAYERQKPHTVVAAPDPRIEVGDIARVAYTASGTGRSENVDVIVESISMQMRVGTTQMVIAGREEST